MAQGQRLEPQPPSEIVLTGIHAESEILMPDTVAAFPVYSRLNRSDHPRQQSLLVEILADVLRPFMDIEIKSHSMPGPMAEITLGVP